MRYIPANGKLPKKDGWWFIKFKVNWSDKIVEDIFIIRGVTIQRFGYPPERKISFLGYVEIMAFSRIVKPLEPKK